MTTGDPKQAVILGLVAVGVVGFAIFRVIPKGEPQRGLATSPRLAQEKPAGETKKKFPTVVLSNAFWHPKIGERPTPPKPAATPTPRPKTMPGNQFNPADPFNGLSGQLNPVGSTGVSQQVNSGPKIRVDAIIGAGARREALLSFGTDELHKAYVGTKFADIEVIAISETAVTLRIGKRQRVIAVGEEKQL
jgi:hypothetical protein